MPQIFNYMGRLCEAAGTTADVSGQKLSHKLIREGYEKVQIEFDENGNPVLPTLVMHPDMVKQLQALPPRTEEEFRAWEELLQRKRHEFNDRRRYRKLS